VVCASRFEVGKGKRRVERRGLRLDLWVLDTMTRAYVSCGWEVQACQ